eukprot:TRINITY_DN18965_c0_g1_i1.p1 TRINITY_DN18965_c0_g1~~TRINITY_DN18965_c0_g1_i1.p1  ORF type:complete len:129 (+),score=39.34 TRINITY_DN18965_c0_g1_i1:60-389(+)
MCIRDRYMGKEYEELVSNLHTEKFFSRNFVIFKTLRKFILACNLGALSRHPLLQILMNIALSFTLLVVVLLFRPFTESGLTVVGAIDELCFVLFPVSYTHLTLPTIYSV